MSKKKNEEVILLRISPQTRMLVSLLLFLLFVTTIIGMYRLGYDQGIKDMYDMAFPVMKAIAERCFK